jgi:hypothetical protein
MKTARGVDGPAGPNVHELLLSATASLLLLQHFVRLSIDWGDITVTGKMRTPLEVGK